jgi:hypothetical protein
MRNKVIFNSFKVLFLYLPTDSEENYEKPLWEPSMETSHMLRTLITDPQQYYSLSLRCYATADKYLPLTCDVAGEMRPR